MMADTDFAEPVAPIEAHVKNGVLNEVGQLWSSVFFSAERTPPKLLVVSAAQRREGVTQIAVSLALAGADSRPHLKIALVDFNVRFPRIADILKLPYAPGVCEVLRGATSLDEALVAVDVGNLSVLTAGEAGDSGMDLLRGDRLRSFCKGLSDHFDHVIIDVPAANLYSDVQVLGGLADGVLLVMRTGVTRRESVAEARRRIEQADGRVIGLVMNQRKYPIPGFVYRRL